MSNTQKTVNCCAIMATENQTKRYNHEKTKDVRISLTHAFNC